MQVQIFFLVLLIICLRPCCASLSALFRSTDWLSSLLLLTEAPLFLRFHPSVPIAACDSSSASPLFHSVCHFESLPSSVHRLPIFPPLPASIQLALLFSVVSIFSFSRQSNFLCPPPPFSVPTFFTIQTQILIQLIISQRFKKCSPTSESGKLQQPVRRNVEMHVSLLEAAVCSSWSV